MAEYSLTELQLDIMAALWTRGEATVVEIQSALLPKRDLAQTTVATLLARMERKGVVTHRTAGRQYVYRASVQESEVRRSVISEMSELAERVFFGDVAALVSHLLTHRDVEAGDLRRVREMIERREAELIGGKTEPAPRDGKRKKKQIRKRRAR